MPSTPLTLTLRPWVALAVMVLSACSSTGPASSAARAAATGTTAVAAPGPAAPVPTPPLSFALVGDMPYGPSEVRVVNALIEDVNADSTVAFVLHVGDIKGGDEPCSDKLLAERHRQVQTFAPPVVFTPGDNDWTDCHRAKGGHHLPTERLAYLRRLFFGNPASSGGQRPMPVISQARQPGHEAYVENGMFVRGEVVFATLHVVGSNNNLEPWNGLQQPDSQARPRADRLAEFKAREAASLAWVDRAFELAATMQARGVVLAFQANPLFERPAGSAARVGFDAVLARIKTRALAFGRPVALLHGDRHQFIHDRPLAASSEPKPHVPNLVRVQTYGSPLLHWIKLTVDPAQPDLFRVEPRTVRLGR